MLEDPPARPGVREEAHKNSINTLFDPKTDVQTQTAVTDAPDIWPGSFLKVALPQSSFVRRLSAKKRLSRSESRSVLIAPEALLRPRRAVGNSKLSKHREYLL